MTNRMTDPYVAKAIDEILSNNPDLPAAELDKAAAALRQDDPDHRRFFTEIKRARPEVTFCWDVERQGVGLRGIRFTTPAEKVIVKAAGNGQ